MKILYLTITAPDDVSFGGGQRSTLLYKALNKCGEVYCLYWRGKTSCNSTHIKRFEQNPLPDASRRINACWSWLYRKILPCRSGNDVLYWPTAFKFDLNAYFPNVKFDCIVTRGYFLSGRFHLWNIAPTYIDIDDHPLQTFATMQSSFLGRWCRFWAALLIQMSLLLINRKIAGAWVSNYQDIIRVGKTRFPVILLPNIPYADSDVLDLKLERKNFLLTVGLLSHPPNMEGVDRFIKTIWQHVRMRYKTLEYWVVGGGVPDDVRERWERIDGVRVLGFVPDLRSVYSMSLATIIPIWSGGGTCIKLLESLAFRRVCLSTEFGARGLASRDLREGKSGVLVFSNAIDFLELLDCKVMNSLRRSELETQGWEYVRANNNMEKFESAVCELLEKK